MFVLLESIAHRVQRLRSWPLLVVVLASALNAYGLRFYLGIPRTGYPTLELRLHEEFLLLVYLGASLCLLSVVLSGLASLAWVLARRRGPWLGASFAGSFSLLLLLPALSGQHHVLRQHRALWFTLVAVVCYVGSVAVFRLLEPRRDDSRRLHGRWWLLALGLGAYVALFTLTEPLHLYPAVLLFLAWVTSIAFAGVTSAWEEASLVRRRQGLIRIGALGSVGLALLFPAWIAHSDSFARVRYIFSRRCTGADGLVRVHVSARTEANKVVAALSPGGAATRISPAVARSWQLRAKPHVVLFVLDAWRADVLKENTEELPRMTRLSHESVWYPRAYSASSGTAQSMLSALSGLPPMVLAQLDVLPVLLPAAFAELGYDTATAWDVDKLRLDAVFPLLRGKNMALLGFSAVIAPSGSDALARDEDQVRRLIERLKTAARPRFEYVHLMASHGPFRGSGARAAYVRTLEHSDRLLGSFLEQLSVLASPTLLVVMGDHGESIGENARWGHNQTLYGVETHVPLMLLIPGHPPRIVPRVTCLTELPSLVFEALGSTWPWGDAGGRAAPHGLAGMILQEYKLLEETAIRTLRTDTHSFHHLHLLDAVEYYDTRTDPLELAPLANPPKLGQNARQLEQEVERWELATIRRLHDEPTDD